MSMQHTSMDHLVLSSNPN
uniref:Uncharacterized protein n=1 Tax=Arundo donax TaxID=35708 RepID=A0A0A8Y2P0_ARUDO